MFVVGGDKTLLARIYPANCILFGRCRCRAQPNRHFFIINMVVVVYICASKSKKNVQTLQFLIDNYKGNIKNIINQKNSRYGATPLDYAYRSNKSPIKKDIVSLLRKYGGKANNYDKNGNQVGKGRGDLNDLVKACIDDDFEKVKALINDDDYGHLIDYTDWEGWNSLHLATEVFKKNVQTLQFLIDNYNGKDIKNIINQKTDRNGWTPLDWAYNNDSPIKNDIVSLLRKYGGKANNYDKNGKSVGKGKGDLND